MKVFFSRLSYSFGNEDFHTEAKALRIKSDDTVLTITASGDRALNILSLDAHKVISVDMNPIQNALLDLKRAALKTFDFADYLSFLGVKPCQKRAQRYKELAKVLLPTSLQVLAPLEKQISKGIIYQGSIEQICYYASLIIRTLRGRKVEKLFSFTDVQEQHNFVKKHWDTLICRNVFRYATHPYISRLFFKDPGLYENLDSPSHLYNRLQSSMSRFLVRENIILSLALTGKVFEEGYPPYLRETQSNQIRKQLDKLTFETTDLLTYLKQREDHSLDVFSLSDVASYLDQEQFSTLLREVVRTAKPGARFCIRQFLSNHSIPEELLPVLKRDSALEKELEREDRCAVYRFFAGSIK